MWQYNEKSAAAELFVSRESVERYDERMGRLGNIQSEVEYTLGEIDLQPSDVLVELGCGTSEFAVRAATKCRKVIAVDISAQMIRFSKAKARSRKVANIEFVCAGFLSYVHSGEKVDKVVTKAALHHISDFWKQIALCRIADMLKPGGIFYLGDAIFSFEPRDYVKVFDQVFAEMTAKVGKKFAEEFVHHINLEYSSFSWVIEGMLERAGLRIIRKSQTPTFANYFCRKV
jgi:ubiquinone/menaquinone biosynthesis C-methylase UbiE